MVDCFQLQLRLEGNAGANYGRGNQEGEGNEGDKGDSGVVIFTKITKGYPITHSVTKMRMLS